MPDRSGFRLAALIAAMACPASVAAQSLEDVVPFDPGSMAETGRFCEANWADVYDDPTLKRMCHNVFICGDGGCLPEYIVAVVAREREEEMRAVVAGLPLDGFAPCDPGDPWQQYYVAPLEQEFEPMGLLGFLEPLRGRDVISYCGKTFPGFEADVVATLRQFGGDDLAASRIGAGAGSPPAQIPLTQAQFLAIRDGHALPLRAPVVAALEALTGERCETTAALTCAVIAERGKVKAQLLFPDGALTGRAGHWEMAHLEVYPANPMADYFELEFDMPITSIRRWPSDREKPTEGFQALDWDDGFESFRQNVMARVTDALETVTGDPG